MSNVMIDIETLSTQSNAAVLSIGLAAFDGRAVTSTCEIKLKPSEVFGHIDVATVAWWMAQSDAARHLAFDGKDSQLSAFHAMCAFFTSHADKASEVWANSPQFDLTILEHWRRGLIEKGIVPHGSPLPWTYRQPRDYRTFMAEWRRFGVPIDEIIGKFKGTAHSAVDDAANQARAVIAIRQWLVENRVIARSGSISSAA